MSNNEEAFLSLVADLEIEEPEVEDFSKLDLEALCSRLNEVDDELLLRSEMFITVSERGRELQAQRTALLIIINQQGPKR